MLHHPVIMLAEEACIKSAQLKNHPTLDKLNYLLIKLMAQSQE